MQNNVYNLVKMLHTKLDDQWRITKHYLKDAKEKKCDCGKIMQTILKDVTKHAQLLQRELNKHMKGGK